MVESFAIRPALTLKGGLPLLNNMWSSGEMEKMQDRERNASDAPEQGHIHFSTVVGPECLHPLQTGQKAVPDAYIRAVWAVLCPDRAHVVVETLKFLAWDTVVCFLGAVGARASMSDPRAPRRVKEASTADSDAKSPARPMQQHYRIRECLKRLTIISSLTEGNEEFKGCDGGPNGVYTEKRYPNISRQESPEYGEWPILNTETSIPFKFPYGTPG